VPRSTSLDSGWEFAAKSWLEPPAKLAFSRLEWLPAEVPGHVHLDLMRHGIIADPFVALGELGCQWVDETDWTYRTEFDFAPDPDLPRRTIEFAGLDTVSSVYLNGELLGEHDNMFVPLSVDVSERLRPGKNELRVEFASAARIGRERRARYLADERLDDAIQRFDERAFVRKAQFMFGWDWGPRLVSAGIWRPVTLVEHAGRIRDLAVIQRHLADGSVALEISSEVQGTGEVVHWVEGFDEPVGDGRTVRIQDPELWWPAGMGAQRLYEVRSVLRGEQREIDSRVTRVGLRTVELLRQPDEHGESFEFSINGRRLWAFGANYIPEHSLPSLASPGRVRLALARARDLGMNMLRVWGGGLYESDDFYQAADELGLLIWQDFAYACSYYPEDSRSLAAARREAEVNVRRLRNHPSLALWCGNNENLTMFESRWGGAEHHPPRYYGERIYDGVLPEVLAGLDPTRPYLPSSPWGGKGANAGGIGDQHTWDVWHGRGDWTHYSESTARFSSEFGFVAAPGFSAWRRMLLPDQELGSTDIRHPIARWHDKTGKGFEKFVSLVELHYPRANDLEEWTYYSQLNQRDALRHGIEHFRRSSFCRGALIWQLNDCWPVQSWAVVDSSGEYKAAAYDLRRLFAPALCSLERSGTEIRLWTVLDNGAAPVSGEARLEARSTDDGRLLERWTAHVDLSPDERKVAIVADLGGCDPASTLVTASFAGSNTFAWPVEPKDVRLRQPWLEARMTEQGLDLRSDLPVVDLFLWDEGGGLSLFDNYVTLPGPGSLVLRAEGMPERLFARTLAGKVRVRPQ
jgi:beta-mannosidase